MYPKSLQYYVNRISNYSRNTYRLSTLNQDTAGPLNVITVSLPNNSVVDLTTLTMFCLGTTITTAGNAVFPRNFDASMIESMQLTIGGALVSSIPMNYGHVLNTILDLTTGEDTRNRRAVLQNASDAAAPTANNVLSQFAIANWLGFLGSARPQYIDTGLLGNVELRLTLASTNVLVASTSPAATGINYSLSNIFFTIDAISLDDGVFYNAMQSYLAKNGVYEVPWKEWRVFTSGSVQQNGTLRFSLSTQALDMVIATFVDNSGTPNTVNTNIANSSYFRKVGSGISGYQYSINNQMYPTFRFSGLQAYQQMINSFNLNTDALGGCHPRLNSTATWLDGFWVAVQRFCHDDEDDGRTIGSIDTRGSVAQCTFEYTGLTNTSVTGLVMCQTSSILRIGQGRQIEVVS